MQHREQHGQPSGSGQEASQEAPHNPPPEDTADGAVADGDTVEDRVATFQAFLRRHRTVTLAYADQLGPQACAVLYACARPDPTQAHPQAADAARAASQLAAPGLYFVSALSTRHGAAFDTGTAAGAPVAFTVQDDAQEWAHLTGLQGRGAVHKLAGSQRDQAFDRYLTAYPFIGGSSTLRDALRRTEIWHLTPHWLRLVDNSQGFGAKREHTFPADEPTTGETAGETE